MLLIHVACILNKLDRSAAWDPRSHLFVQFSSHRGVVDAYGYEELRLSLKKDIPSWVMSHYLLAMRPLPIFFPIAVLPMNAHMDCVRRGPLGLRCYPNVSGDDFDEA